VRVDVEQQTLLSFCYISLTSPPLDSHINHLLYLLKTSTCCMSHVRASLGERFAHHKQLDDEKKEEAGWCFGFYFFHPVH
jgi:hypothetical protein